MAILIAKARAGGERMSSSEDDIPLANLKRKTPAASKNAASKKRKVSSSKSSKKAKKTIAKQKARHQFVFARALFRIDLELRARHRQAQRIKSRRRRPKSQQPREMRQGPRQRRQERLSPQKNPKSLIYQGRPKRDHRT